MVRFQRCTGRTRTEPSILVLHRPHPLRCYFSPQRVPIMLYIKGQDRGLGGAGRRPVEGVGGCSMGGGVAAFWLCFEQKNTIGSWPIFLSF